MVVNDKTKFKRLKPVVLIVLDGWGVNLPYAGNAIAQANTPFFDKLITEYPTTTLGASGESVGLPWGEMGNSEVGHLNIGLGRILYQDLPRINKSISDRDFYKNEAILKAIKHSKKNKSKLHILGVVSDGCVHSSINHLFELLLLAKTEGLNEVFIHAILDGRDTPYNSGVGFIKKIELNIKEYEVGKIATISGRYYTMDRNNHWDRIAKAYDAMTQGYGNESDNPIKAIEDSYKKKIFDEELLPTVIKENGKPVATISNNDSVIFFNFRPDRARQITKAFVLEEFSKFKRKELINNLVFTCFTEYEKGLPVLVAFPPEKIKNVFGEIIAKAGLKQLRIAETEKYAHVTYFFNGGREEKSVGEDHFLVPSAQVPNYDLKPEMSAPEITKKIVDVVNDDKYDFILVNYANSDMVGHTGNIDATIAAIETIDRCLEKIVTKILSKDGIALITSDHGNSEDMYNMQTGQIGKEHSVNPVPFIIVGRQYVGRNIGWEDVVGGDLSLIQPQGVLSDIVPTILKIMKLKQPKEITGVSLIT